jgi:SAM-dependent methyltransferase
MVHKNILGGVNEYYTSKVKEHGNTPQGVDWNSVESQELRFDQLSRIITSGETVDVLDFGCGFGSMHRWFQKQGKRVNYTGYDISEEMIGRAKEMYKGDERCSFLTELPERKFDYVIASGIFNVKLDTPEEEWLQYVVETLEIINERSIKGFSFNLLTSYSDKPFMKDNLFYGDPLLFFDYCKTRFSKYVNLVHDYPLYEFTMLVRKDIA